MFSNDPVLSYRITGALDIIKQASIRYHLRKLVTILGYNKLGHFLPCP
jgi:hypothetical protein